MSDYISDNESDSISTELDDIELLQDMSREDLFSLIRTDPKYYLDLIKDNNLEQQLYILISRASDGGCLNIKFRIYPEDRWTEVGYFSDGTDEQVLEDFVNQINFLLNRTRHYDKYEHLSSQLDKNNNMLSMEYGQDFKEMGQNKTSIEKKLDHFMNTSKQMRKNETENLKDTINRPPQNIKDKPIDTLNNFVAIILDKILKELPKIININDTINYDSILNSIKLIEPPDQYKKHHDSLIKKISGCQYVQKIHYAVDWDKNEELHDYLIDFHHQAIRLNSNLYSIIKKDVLLNLLDDEDKEILEKYSLDIQDLWLDYLKNNYDP